MHPVDALSFPPTTDPAALDGKRPPYTNPLKPQTPLRIRNPTPVQAVLHTQGLRLQHPLPDTLGTQQEIDALLESALQCCRVLALDSVTPLLFTPRGGCT